MATVTLTENYETYRTRHFLFQKEKPLQNQLEIQKYSILNELLNLNFDQLKMHLLSDTKCSLNYKSLYEEIDKYIKSNKFLKNKFHFARNFNKLLGNSLAESNYLSLNSTSIISYFTSSFFFYKDDTEIMDYFSKHHDLEHIVMLSLDELQHIIDFIKQYYDKYDGKIDDLKEFEFISRNCFNKNATEVSSKINIAAIAALFEDEVIKEFLDTFDNYHKSIDFFYEKVKMINDKSLRAKIVKTYYNDKHSSKPKIKNIYDLGLNEDEMFEYLQLVYSNQQRFQQAFKKYYVFQFSDYQEYFEIIFRDMFENNRKLKICNGCGNFFVSNASKGGNHQFYCSNCKNKNEYSEFIKKYSNKFKKTPSLSNIDNKIVFPKEIMRLLNENILCKIIKDSDRIRKEIEETNNFDEKNTFISVYKKWKSSNEQIHKREYIKKQYMKSKFYNSDSNTDFEFQYYRLDKDFKLVLKRGFIFLNENGNFDYKE